MGARPSPAHRHRGRPGLPGRGGQHRGRRQPHLRDRRPGLGVLRRDHDGVHPPARPEALHDPRALPDAATVQPVARPDHARLRPHRPQAHRLHAQRDARHQRRCPARVLRAPARPAAGDRASAGQRGPRVRRDALVRRPLDPGRDPELRWQARRHASGRFARRAGQRLARARVRGHRGHRRRHGLVRQRHALAPARPHGPRRRRAGPATRPARPEAPARRRPGGLLARRGGRARRVCCDCTPR